MPRSYFDIKDGEAFYPDEDGLELADRRAAEIEAAMSLAGVARELPVLDERRRWRSRCGRMQGRCSRRPSFSQQRGRDIERDCRRRSDPARPGAMKMDNRACKCGAVYRRTESMAPGREIDSFECAVCGVTMERWNSAWVPTYRLIVGSVTKPDS
jgi:hypothetical protein